MPWKRLQSRAYKVENMIMPYFGRQIVYFWFLSKLYSSKKPLINYFKFGNRQRVIFSNKALF